METQMAGKPKGGPPFPIQASHSDRVTKRHRGLSTWVPGFREGTRSLIILASETVTPPTTKRMRRGWSLG